MRTPMAPALRALLFLIVLPTLFLVPWTARAQEDTAPPAAPGEATLEEDCGDDDLGSPVALSAAREGSLLLKTDHPGLYLQAPALATEVAIRATGIVARATVTQRFQNPTELWVEGVYVFPLPENAAVDTLRMVIGDRVVEGQIQEREEARRTFEEAKAQGFKASLVEQERPNLFTTAVANLGPEEVVEVVIEYQQEVRYDAGVFSLRFPMTTTPRYQPAAGLRTGPAATDPPARPVAALHAAALSIAQTVAPEVAGPLPDPDLHRPALDSQRGPRLSLSVDLEPGFPLARVDSRSHALRKQRIGPLSYRVELAAGQVPANRDFVLEWQPAAGAAPQAGLFLQQGKDSEGGDYALLMVLPPAGLAAEKQDLPREVLFVIDTSGSMAGASIVQAKEALGEALARLEPRDFFNVIEFNSDLRVLFPQSVPASWNQREKARAFVSSLDADGGTEMLPALQMALAGTCVAGADVRQIVFITDGAVTNEQALFALLQAQLGESRLFTVGIGSAPNSYFMTRAAELGRGTFTYVGNPEEVREKIGGLFAKLDRPVLTDLEITWSDPQAEAYPPQLPDLYAGEPIVLAVRLPSGGEKSIAQGLKVSGRAAGRYWEAPLAAMASAPGSGLDKLWARRRIDELERQATAGVLLEPIRLAIVELGRAYHLVTRFTSLVAVDTTPTRPAGEAAKTVLLPIQPPAGYQEMGTAEAPLPSGATSARLDLLLGLLLLLAGGGWLWRSRRLLVAEASRP